MKTSSYSSLTAFVAHYRALKSGERLSEDERSRLSDMKRLLDSMGPEIRTALDFDAAGDGARRRHRERAERKLRLELIDRGMLTG